MMGRGGLFARAAARRSFSSTPTPEPVGPRMAGRSRGPLGWGSVAALVVVGGVVVSYYSWLRQRRIKALETKSIGRPAIGGPFSLVDHHGEPVTDTDFRGKYLLVYFGFTYCPDICPAELTKLGNVMEELKVAGFDDAVTPLMISVDPRRDTVEQLARYVKEFHPRLIGLTGTPKQVQDVAKLYRVYASTGFTDEEVRGWIDCLVVFLTNLRRSWRRWTTIWWTTRSSFISWGRMD